MEAKAKAESKQRRHPSFRCLHSQIYQMTKSEDFDAVAVLSMLEILGISPMPDYEVPNNHKGTGRI